MVVSLFAGCGKVEAPAPETTVPAPETTAPVDPVESTPETTAPATTAPEKDDTNPPTGDFSIVWLVVLAVALGCRTVGDSSVGSDAYDLYFREADLEAVSGGDALRAEKKATEVTDNEVSE